MEESLCPLNGVRAINFDFEDRVVNVIRNTWLTYLETIDGYPEGDFEGKGIVICAGGIKYFTNAWIAITQIRFLGCRLPIEVWFKDSELSSEVIANFEQLQVDCKNVSDYEQTNLKGYGLKPLAILLSKFEEVLYLDADNNCLYDPTDLFFSKEYNRNGAIFWPDYWSTSSRNPIWRIVDSVEYDLPEQESGQILINKRRCWKELQLCLYFNRNSNLYYKLLYGDKDTFKFAWLALKTPFYMIQSSPGSCGYMTKTNSFRGVTMVQYDILGHIIFLHRNLLKWDVANTEKFIWEKIKRFSEGFPEKKFYFKKTETHYYIDLAGDVMDHHCSKQIKDYEIRSYEILKELRESTFFINFCKENL